MIGDPERDKLDALSARIKIAEGKSASDPAADTMAAEMAPGRGDGMKAGRVGFDFVATVAACAAIGWFADRKFGSAPWGLLGMLLAGFAAGFLNIWRALSRQDKT
jgi:ATP synthase protein I